MTHPARLPSVGLPNKSPTALTLTGLLLTGLFAASPAAAQFASGSTGADGALNIAGGQGAIVWDATGLDPENDSVFHFTTIDVGAGTFLILRADNPKLYEGIPVVWLASGDVNIGGELRLEGLRGHDTTTTPLPAVPGAGGFAGGPGGQVSANFPKAGSGPGGGGASPTNGGGNASHRTVGISGVSREAPGAVYGNAFLLPMIGGSGGGGAPASATTQGTGGGAGGGAILIASDGTLDVTGYINCSAGIDRYVSPYYSGYGSGGAIRLIAPTISGNGQVRVTRYTGSNPEGSGWIRIEAFNHNHAFNRQPITAVTVAAPGPVFPPINTPTVAATTIGGVAIPGTPTGSFVTPDAILNTLSPINIDIAAQYIPVGTTVQVTVVPENGASLNLVSTPLAGTLDNSTATVGPFTLPSGYSRFFVTATWTP